MIVKLLTEHHLEFLSLKGGCTGRSESIHVKMHTLFEITCSGSYAIQFQLYMRTMEWYGQMVKVSILLPYQFTKDSWKTNNQQN